MSRRVVSFSTAAVLVAAVPVWAAQSAPPTPQPGLLVPGPTSAPPSAPDVATRSSAFTYEMALRSAVVLGGQKLAQQFAAVVPDGILAFAEQPIVRGVKLDGWGYFFDVQAPNIQSTIMALDMMNQSRRTRPGAPAVPSANPDVQPVGGRAVVSATGVVEPDPMADDLAAPGGPDRAYSKYVREALIDALLDSSAMLPLAADDHLTIAAQGIDQPGSNPLYQTRKLMLTIKGSDLQDMRQGRITREQAKARIAEGRF